MQNNIYFKSSKNCQQRTWKPAHAPLLTKKALFAIKCIVVLLSELSFLQMLAYNTHNRHIRNMLYAKMAWNTAFVYVLK